MQRRRGAIVADIGDRLALGGERVQPLEIGALVDEAAFLQDIRKSDLNAVICRRA